MNLSQTDKIIRVLTKLLLSLLLEERLHLGGLLEPDQKVLLQHATYLIDRWIEDAFPLRLVKRRKSLPGKRTGGVHQATM